MQASCTRAPARVSSSEEAKCRAEGQRQSLEWEAARPLSLLQAAGEGAAQRLSAALRASRFPPPPRAASWCSPGGEPMTEAGGGVSVSVVPPLRMACARSHCLRVPPCQSPQQLPKERPTPECK